MSYLMEYGNRLNMLLSRSLSSLRTPLARLVFVASMHDPYAGRYLHEGWGTVASAEDVHLTIQQAHLAVFQTVLDLPLEELCGQLHDHFSDLGGADREMAKQWLLTEPFRNAIPESVSKLQREFFLSQVTTALWILVDSSSSGVLPERFASRLLRPAPQFPHHLEI